MKKAISVLALAFAVIIFPSTDYTISKGDTSSKNLGLYSIQQNHYDPGH
ncbi:hypothetical protein [Brevibacillus laterosporus]|nr:hypothetical protein [Brevibacillus laterosporus]